MKDSNDWVATTKDYTNSMGRIIFNIGFRISKVIAIKVEWQLIDKDCTSFMWKITLKLIVNEMHIKI